MGRNSIVNQTAEPHEVPSIETVDEFDELFNNYIKPEDTVALLMDYDGTLAPITANPQLTFMPEKTSELFKKICKSEHVFPAVISGRGINDVRSRVGVDNITYAGCHGLEIQYTNGKRFDYEIPTELLNNFPKMYEELKEFEKIDNTIWVENKQLSLTVHYHALPKEKQIELLKQCSEIIVKYGYSANKAHGAVDAKPPVQWNKGKAAEQILESNFGPNWRDKVKVVFAGDDNTDEDAMKALKGKGLTFRVSKNPNIITNATYRLASPEQVYLMLNWLDKRVFSKST